MSEKVKVSKYEDLENRDRPYCPYKPKPQDRTLVLMDVMNLSRILSEELPRTDIDFRKLMIEAVDGCNCVAAIAVDSESSKDKRGHWSLLREVVDNGFRLETVPEEFSEDRGGDYGAIALFAQEFAIEDWCDRIVIITGDRDFSYLVKNLQRRGKFVEIMTFNESRSTVADRVISMWTLPLIRVDFNPEGVRL